MDRLLKTALVVLCVACFAAFSPRASAQADVPWTFGKRLDDLEAKNAKLESRLAAIESLLKVSTAPATTKAGCSCTAGGVCSCGAGCECLPAGAIRTQTGAVIVPNGSGGYRLHSEPPAAFVGASVTARGSAPQFAQPFVTGAPVYGGQFTSFGGGCANGQCGVPTQQFGFGQQFTSGGCANGQCGVPVQTVRRGR